LAVIKTYENFFRDKTYDDLDLTIHTGASLIEGVVRISENDNNFSINSQGTVTLELNPGAAYLGGLHGYFVNYERENIGEYISLSFDQPATSPRRDLVVVEVKRDTAEINVKVIKNPDEGVSAPDLVQDLEGTTATYQIPLYEVKVELGGNLDITDLRQFVMTKDSYRFNGAELSTDSTFSEVTDDLVPTVSAVKNYVDGITGDTGSLTTTSTSNLVSATNSLKTKQDTIDTRSTTNESNISTIETNIGNVTTLETSAKVVVDAINELHEQFDGFTVNLVQSDWNVTDTQSDAYIKNKPDSLTKVDLLHTFTLTGSTSDRDDQVWSAGYNDITGGPYLALILVLNDNDQATSSMTIPVADFLSEQWYEITVSTNTNAYGRAQSDVVMNLSKGIIRTNGTDVLAKLPASATDGTMKMKIYGLK